MENILILIGITYGVSLGFGFLLQKYLKIPWMFAALFFGIILSEFGFFAPSIESEPFQLLATLGMLVIAFHDWFQFKSKGDKEAEKVLEEAEQYLKKEKINYNLSSILGSNPSRALVNIAKHENFDLIVVGSRGLGSAASFLLGSVSKKVVSKAHCDVLVVKQ